ncbi:MAG: PAS domain S-box protein [Nitrospirae bacterium]|nr:PAS domain S-box protein [Nitrospirota bacterium]
MIHDIYLKNDLDVIYFIYGLAFFLIGYSILTQYKANSIFKIGKFIWLLGLFGIIHGINEWLDMWAVIKGRTKVLDYIRWIFLVSSFCFLFEFGFRIFMQNLKVKSKIHRMFSSDLWLLSLIVFIILAISIRSGDFWKTGNIMARYFMGFPGSVLTGLGFILYYRREDPNLKQAARMKYKLWALSGSFFIYGILGGLIVPRSDFFPSNWLNVESFHSVVNMPVRMIRAIFVVISAWNIARILSVFQWETNNRLEDALVNAKQSEEKYRSIVDNVGMGIAVISRDMKIISLNSQAKKWYPHIDTTQTPVCYQSFNFNRQPADNMCPHCQTFKTLEDGRVYESVVEAVVGDETRRYRIISTPIINEPAINGLAINKSAINAPSKVSAAIEMLEDITERLKVEDELRQTKVLLEKTFASLDQAVFIICPDTRVILSCNPAARRVFGYKEDDMVGRNTEFLHVDMQMYERFGREMFDDLDANGIFRIEYTMRKKDGSVFFTENTVTAIVNNAGNRIAIVSVIRDVTDRKKIGDELIASREQLRLFAIRLQTLIEKERTRIARELHDELGQSLTSLKIDIDELLVTSVSPDDFQLTAKISKIEQSIDAIIDRMHSIATVLRPSILDELGLITAIEWQAREFRERTGIDCKVRYNHKIRPYLERIDKESSTALFRIFQETLTNVSRHAKANKVGAYLYKKDTALIMKIVDDGIGIDENKIFNNNSLGLLGMRERVSMLGWTLNIKGKPGMGTVIKIFIPGAGGELDD